MYGPCGREIMVSESSSVRESYRVTVTCTKYSVSVSDMA